MKQLGGELRDNDDGPAQDDPDNYVQSTMYSPDTAIVAPVNISTDLAEDSLRTTAALRMADHHLNTASGFIPAKNVDLFVVSQACLTFPVTNLREQLKMGSFVASKMWVEDLGRTSITFGHAITFHGKFLALITRIYVRKNVKTGNLLEISMEERYSLFLATPRKGVDLPQVCKLDVPSKHDMRELFTVRIGPQHCNNAHVDHAALADLVLQGMYIQGYEAHKLSLRYLAPSELNQTLSCCVHKDHPLVALYKDGARSSPLVIGQVDSSRTPLSRL